MGLLGNKKGERRIFRTMKNEAQVKHREKRWCVKNDAAVVLQRSLSGSRGKGLHLTYCNVLTYWRFRSDLGVGAMFFTDHPGIGILGAVAEGRCQGARAALVVVGVLSIVYRAIYADRPHARRVAVAVAVVLLAAVARRPNVNVAQSLATLKT